MLFHDHRILVDQMQLCIALHFKPTKSRRFVRMWNFFQLKDIGVEIRCGIQFVDDQGRMVYLEIKILGMGFQEKNTGE
jgi:hypothetical protein